MAITQARKDQIWAHLVEGTTNINGLISDRSKFNSEYDYASKTADEKAVLDAFFGSAATLMQQGKSAFQAVSALKANPSAYQSAPVTAATTPASATTTPQSTTTTLREQNWGVSAPNGVQNTPGTIGPGASRDQVVAFLNSRGVPSGQIGGAADSFMSGGEADMNRYLGFYGINLASMPAASAANTTPGSTTGTVNGNGTISASTGPNYTGSQINGGAWINTNDTPSNPNYDPAKAQHLDNGGLQINDQNDQKNFDAGFNAYVKAQQDVYAMDTSRQNQTYGYQGEDLSKTQQRGLEDVGTNLQKGLQSYDWQAQDAANAISRNREDYATFTGREQSDTARQLALNSTDFSKALSSATQAYGKRGLLQSGIQNASNADSVNTFGENQGYFKTLSQRRLQDASTNMNRSEQDYTNGAGRLATQRGQLVDQSGVQSNRINQDYATNAGRLDTQKTQYASDRAAGSQALGVTLQQQGDTLYNNAQVQRVQLAQAAADQAALDKLYGRTPQNRPLSMRLGGVYS